jgi:hypothetical protein
MLAYRGHMMGVLQSLEKIRLKNTEQEQGMRIDKIIVQKKKEVENFKHIATTLAHDFSK